MSDDQEKTEIDKLKEDIYNINHFLERAIFKDLCYTGVVPARPKNLGRKHLSEALRDGFYDCMLTYEREERAEKRESREKIKKTLKIAGLGALSASLVMIPIFCLVFWIF